MKLHVVVVASIVAATAVLGSCADMDRVSASLTEPTADLSLGPGWDWDGIGIATGGGGSTPKPCEGGPPEPTGDGPLVQHGDVGVANECPPDPWDPPEICYHYVAYAPPLVWGGYMRVYDSWGKTMVTVKVSPYRDDTTVYGMVKYYSDTGWKEEPFIGVKAFITGPGLSGVDVKFYGYPLGTGLNLQVCDSIVPGDDM